jgi:hypothetical protein
VKEVLMYNQSGQRVLKVNTIAEDGGIRVGQLAPGLHIVTITDVTGKVHTFKVMIVK